MCKQNNNKFKTINKCEKIKKNNKKQSLKEAKYLKNLMRFFKQNFMSSLKIEFKNEKQLKFKLSFRIILSKLIIFEIYCFTLLMVLI